MSLPPSSAPIATGRSDSCRAGFAPAGEWRLVTAHQSILLGMLLAFISFVFYKLDTRTQFLIKHSENVLKELEESFRALDAPNVPHKLQLFRWEEVKTERAKKQNGACVWRNHLTYGQCLKYIFSCFIVVGLLGSSISAMRLTEWCSALH